QFADALAILSFGTLYLAARSVADGRRGRDSHDADGGWRRVHSRSRHALHPRNERKRGGWHVAVPDPVRDHGGDDDALVDHQGGRYRAGRPPVVGVRHRRATRHPDRAAGQARSAPAPACWNGAGGRAAHGFRPRSAARRGLFGIAAVIRVLLALVALVMLGG